MVVLGFGDTPGPGRVSGHVGFGPHHQPRSFQQLGLVAGQLVEKDPLLVGRVTVFRTGQVKEEHQHPGPLHVAQEPVPEPPALGGALDEAGHVGHDELGASSMSTTPRLGTRVVKG